MFDLLGYLFGTTVTEEKYHNRWEQLVRKNTIHHTILIDWDLIHNDLLIFNCSQYDIKIEYNGKNTRIDSYLGCEGEPPRYTYFNFANEDTIKITCNNRIINKKIYPKTILYLEDTDLSDD
jgi:hypothetical protein